MSCRTIKTVAVHGQRQLATAAAPPSAPKCIRIVLLGAPGSGKGTHASNLAKHFGTRTIVAGDLLRSEISKGSPIGVKAAQVMRDGGLMSDSVMEALLRKALQASTGHNVVFDGYPRNAQQAKQLDELLQERNESLDLVLNLDVPDGVILERIEGRWIHEPSGRVFNTGFNPPKSPGLDDITGEKLTKRIDDDPKVYEKRLNKFHELTGPVIDYYRVRDPAMIRTVSGPTSKIIWPQVEKVMKERFGGLNSKS